MMDIATFAALASLEPPRGRAIDGKDIITSSSGRSRPDALDAFVMAWGG
jgi:hypothetical protein